METVAEIRRRHLVDGEPISGIARELRLSRNIVKKYLHQTQPPAYRRREQPKPKLGNYEEVAIHFAQVPSTSCGRHHLFPLQVFGKRAEVPIPFVASSGKKVIHVSERSGD
jgi:hypothetical protein